MEDNAIINLFWQRSEDALTECERKFGAYCRSIAVNILCSQEDANECVNETWLKAWNAIPPAKPNKLKTFLGRIARNLALDRYEAAHTQKRNGAFEIALVELAEIPVPEQAEEGEITRVINSFLRSEPNDHADIFIKRYWYLASVKEIAAEAGYTESKTISLLFRMRSRLKAKLKSEGLL